jgi:hypothetical protein
MDFRGPGERHHVTLLTDIDRHRASSLDYPHGIVEPHSTPPQKVEGSYSAIPATGRGAATAAQNPGRPPPFETTARKSSTWSCALKIVPSNSVPSQSGQPPNLGHVAVAGANLRRFDQGTMAAGCAGGTERKARTRRGRGGSGHA